MVLETLYIVGAATSIVGGAAAVASAIKARNYRDGAKSERDKIIDRRRIIERTAIIKDIESFQNIINMFAPGCTATTLQGVDFHTLNISIRECYRTLDTESRRLRLQTGDNAPEFTRLEEAVNTFCIATNNTQRLDAGNRLHSTIRDILVKLKQQLDDG